MLGSSPCLIVKPSPIFCLCQSVPTNSQLKILQVETTEQSRNGGRRRERTQVFPCLSISSFYLHRSLHIPKSSFDHTSQQPLSSDVEESKESSSSSSSLGDGYVSLFVGMLGLGNDPLDRDQGIVALWKYSLGGKKNVDNIMKFPGCINLTVNLLRSDSSSTCEAAAGLLRSISLFNVYKDLVAESGAIEEITGLLNRPSLASEVKEQSLCTLWNLSVDGNLREKMANTDILPILVRSLDDEDIKVKEAAGGVLANLALSQVNHKIMVEEGVIPKLAKLLKNNSEGSKVIRKEARNALLELSRDEYYKILIVEEGLVHVPLIGAAAYKSYRPGLHSWPSLPDGTEIERGSQKPSRFGASELLLGLNVDDKNSNIDEGKRNAMVGRTQQQFLVRIGAVETEESGSESVTSSSCKVTLLPWIDGVARLVLILELEDEIAVSRAAESIGDASISEEMRVAFRDAGAVRHLVRLLGYKHRSFKYQIVRALERLSVSHSVCQVIEAEGVVDPLLDILRCQDSSEDLLTKTLDIFARILDTSKEKRSKLNDGAVNGLKFEKTSSLAEEGIRKADLRDNMLDLSAINRLVEILKTSPSNLQRKAASVLEFIAITDSAAEMISSADIESGFDVVFKQRILEETDSDLEGKEPEKYAIEIEEASLAISAASRLLTKLLNSNRCSIDPNRFTLPLRTILKSNKISLECKEQVAACLVKLTSSDPIRTEVTIFETIPRLVEQIKASSPSLAAREDAAVILSWIFSEGLVGGSDLARAVASRGGIPALVELIGGEGMSDRAVEAGVSILYNVSLETENHAEIVATGAVPVLKRIVLSQRPQWNKALLLLRTLPT